MSSDNNIQSRPGFFKDYIYLPGVSGKSTIRVHWDITTRICNFFAQYGLAPEIVTVTIDNHHYNLNKNSAEEFLKQATLIDRSNPTENQKTVTIIDEIRKVIYPTTSAETPTILTSRPATAPLTSPEEIIRIGEEKGVEERMKLIKGSGNKYKGTRIYTDPHPQKGMVQVGTFSLNKRTLTLIEGYIEKDKKLISFIKPDVIAQTSIKGKIFRITKHKNELKIIDSMGKVITNPSLTEFLTSFFSTRNAPLNDRTEKILLFLEDLSKQENTAYFNLLPKELVKGWILSSLAAGDHNNAAAIICRLSTNEKLKFLIDEQAGAVKKVLPVDDIEVFWESHYGKMA